MDRKKLFFTLIDAELCKYGFQYLRSKNSFVRKEEGNEYYFEFELWPGFAQVETELRIILQVVEKIKKEAWGSNYGKFESLGRQKTYLINEPSKATSPTSTEEEVRLAVKEELDFYHRFAKDYYRKYSDVHYVDKVLNSVPGKELYLSHNPANTSFLAIIVAHLTSNPRFDELVRFYRRVVNDFNDIHLEDYDPLVEYLIKQK